MSRWSVFNCKVTSAPTVPCKIMCTQMKKFKLKVDFKKMVFLICNNNKFVNIYNLSSAVEGKIWLPYESQRCLNLIWEIRLPDILFYSEKFDSTPGYIRRHITLCYRLHKTRMSFHVWWLIIDLWLTDIN